LKPQRKITLPHNIPPNRSIAAPGNKTHSSASAIQASGEWSPDSKPSTIIATLPSAAPVLNASRGSRMLQSRVMKPSRFAGSSSRRLFSGRRHASFQLRPSISLIYKPCTGCDLAWPGNERSSDGTSRLNNRARAVIPNRSVGGVQRLRQPLHDIARLVDLTALDRRVTPEAAPDGLGERFRAVDDEQPRHCRIKPALDQIVDQRLD